MLSDAKVKSTLAHFLDLPTVEIEKLERLPSEATDLIPKKYVIDNRIVPFEVGVSEIKVAISEPSALRGISSTRLITCRKITAYVISPIEMQFLLDSIHKGSNGDYQKPDGSRKFDYLKSLKFNDGSQSGVIDSEELLRVKKKVGQATVIKAGREVGGEQNKVAKTKTPGKLDPITEDHGSNVISFVNNLINDAVSKGASDIHIEIYKESAVLRYRIDGVLLEKKEFKDFLVKHYSAITTRVKIMATLDISERRLPQDGAIVTTLPDGRDIDLRVSVLPTVFGERVVMRILDRGGMSFDLDKLGFPEREYKDIISAFDSSQGMVLVTGPTGSGKSTTLYGALRRLNKPGINILTAEDPVEFTVEGVGQVQIREDIGLTFSQALRSFLRQDPEVILVGEIRDKDTADISIKAALTGHLVLSTLHANNAISTIVRLVNMGIPGYLIGAALTLVIAQRLARRICPNCKQIHEGDHEALLIVLGFKADDAKLARPYVGAGCASCNHTGYKGRQGIYEALKISEKLRAAIIENLPATTLNEIALADGFRTMQDIGQKMVLDGVLTIDEYQRNLIFN